MIPVEHIMNRHILKIAHESTVREAARMMRDDRVGSLFVIKDGEYVGIFTETDLARKVVAAPLPPESATVGDVMSTPIITIDSNEPLIEAYSLMHVCGVRHLAVTTDGEIVGVVSSRDLLHPFYGKANLVGGRSRGISSEVG